MYRVLSQALRPFSLSSPREKVVPVLSVLIVDRDSQQMTSSINGTLGTKGSQSAQLPFKLLYQCYFIIVDRDNNALRFPSEFFSCACCVPVPYLLGIQSTARHLKGLGYFTRHAGLST